MDNRVTIAELLAAKHQGRKIVAISCYDHGTARLISQTDVQVMSEVLEELRQFGRAYCQGFRSLLRRTLKAPGTAKRQTVTAPSCRLLGNRQVEFDKDLFHVLPDLSTIIRRVIAQQISSVICRHKLYGGTADLSVVFVELASQLAYRLGAVEQRPIRMSAEGDENLRFNYFNLSLEVGQAAYYLVGPGVAIARRATL